MSESDIEVDRELQRLLEVTRHRTEPDASAHARIQAALRQRLSPARVNGASRGRLRFKPWLIIGGGMGILAAVLSLHGLERDREPPQSLQAPSPVGTLAAPPPAEAPSSTSSVLAVPSAPERTRPTAAASTQSRNSEPNLGPNARRSATPVAGGDELSLLVAMQRALRNGDANGALSLAEEHARRFPSGALTEERESGRGVARCRLAPSSERAAVLAEYLGRYAHSPYAPRVRDACAR
jgi:hypothetical protein